MTRGIPTLVLTAVMFAVFATFANAQTDDETITVIESEVVLLNATITDSKGLPVNGLKKSDFKIFEDGKEQTLDFFSAQSTPFAAVILLDSSGSMEQRVSLARSAAIQFLEKLRLDDVAAIYNFDSKISLVQDFSSSRDLYDGAFNIKADGMTVLNDAIVKAADELNQRTEKRRAIIVLSDGADTFSKTSGDKALQAALAANATIYTVDMSSPESNDRSRAQNQAALKSFAGKSGGRFVDAPGGTALREAFKGIVEELGTQYTLGYAPLNTARDGKWRAIELKSTRAGVNIRTRKGYNARKK